MPNHISNKLMFKSPSEDWQAEEKALEGLKQLMKTDDGPFDFNVLFPYPPELAAADDAHNKAEMAKVPWNDRPADGYNHGGYEWCIANWGTKWNSYDFGEDYDSITFNTAWATPTPIFAEISKRFPTLQLVVEYADEDEGRNCGIAVFSNGVLIDETDEDDLPDPQVFARAVRAEQSNNETRRDLNEAKEKIKELEKQIALLKAGAITDDAPKS